MDYLINVNYEQPISNDVYIIDSLAESFEGNKRMEALIGKKEKFQDGIRSVISFSYYMVKKYGGIYTSENKTTFLFYYRISEHYFSLKNILDYLYLAFFVIGIHRVPQVVRREKKIKKTRHLQIQKNDDKDFIYVWFLAQKKNCNELKGLVEAKNFILQKAKELQLPIYMETTDERLLNMYRRAGFEFYDSLEEEKTGMKIWFGRCESKV